jgi:hypothetical protein
MNTDQAALAFRETEAEGQTYSTNLQAWGQQRRRAEHYRVIAHTRTLSPDDEMLRILEAMGILALHRREMPAGPSFPH